jgi:hypothetical protein
LAQSHRSFDIDEESKFDYDPWLPRDPNPETSPIAGGSKASLPSEGRTDGNNGEIEGNNPRLTFPPLMIQAMRERRHGNLSQASATCRTIISNTAMPMFARQWALSQLLALAQRMPQTSSLTTYFSSVIQSQPSLARSANGLLPFSHFREGSSSRALAAFAANMQQYPNSDIACSALYGSFAYALFNANDTSNARRLLNQLLTNHAASTEAKLAARQMQSDGGNGPSSGMHKDNATLSHTMKNTPTEYVLEQNYPNPFNPTTHFGFRIADVGLVTLKIYDLLGREVAALVNEVKSAGAYSVSFDASKLSSGVYIYILKAGNFTASKKFLLLK